MFVILLSYKLNILMPYQYLYSTIILKTNINSHTPQNKHPDICISLYTLQHLT